MLWKSLVCSGNGCVVLSIMCMVLLYQNLFMYEYDIYVLIYSCVVKCRMENLVSSVLYMEFVLRRTLLRAVLNEAFFHGFHRFLGIQRRYFTVPRKRTEVNFEGSVRFHGSQTKSSISRMHLIVPDREEQYRLLPK